MTDPLRFEDADLVAYVDGELAPERRALIAAQAAQDAALQSRIDAYTASRKLLQTAFAATLDEPLPAALLELVRNAPHAPAVAPASAPSALRRHRRARIALGIAASILIAATLVLLMPRGAERQALEIALEQHASGVPYLVSRDGHEVSYLPTRSLRTQDGRYCRELETAIDGAAQTPRSLACRATDGSWRSVTLVADAAPTSSGYAQASGATDQVIQRTLGSTVALTPEQEDALVRNGWAQ